jgi:hypothetical protein
MPSSSVEGQVLTSDPTTSRSAAAPLLAVTRLVAAAVVLLFACTPVFVEAYHAPRLRGLRIGVVGSPGTAARVGAELDALAPGSFRVRDYPSEAAARRALRGTDVHAVLVQQPFEDRVLVAGASGVPATRLTVAAFESLATRTHARLAVTDVARLPAHDRLGLSALFTVVATLLPSLGFGALLALRGAGLAARVRWAVIGAYAVLAGLVVALSVDILVGALTGTFGGVAGIVGLFALAVAATAHGLTRAAGPAGLASAFALLFLLGLSSSGGAVTPPLQPDFYSLLSGWLPPGAALGALRRAVYFDWADTTHPLLVLAGWAVGGLLVGLAAERHRHHDSVKGRTT